MKSSNLWLKAFACLACAALLQPAIAAPAAPVTGLVDSERPKIGLALSGGGARGAAHIGVLKVLEEYQVPVDYIAGTSMGSIVGGLFASGLDVAEIENIVSNVNWGEAFKDKIPREDRSFRRKRDDDLYLVKAKPGYNDGQIEFPAGFIQGQQIDLMLERFTVHVAEIRDFDKLSIPFRAVASDLATGDAVVISDGMLSVAMRASMSIPAVFTPVELNGRLLADGGVSNNLPIDVVREMGADIVIAVDISTPLMTKEQLKSVLSITAQLTGILTRKNTDEQIATLTAADIFMVPDLGDISTSEFGRAAEAVPIGELEARKYEEPLRQLALPDALFQTHVAARAAPSRELPIIDEVRMTNNSRLGDAAVMAHLNIAEGEPLDLTALEAQIGRVYGLELFQLVFWELEREDGRNVLTIHVKERPWGPNYLQFGLGVADDFSGDNSFNLALAYTRTAINRLGGEWRTALAVGSDPEFFTELYQPLDTNNRYFINPGVLYSKRSPNLFDSSGNKIAEIDVESTQLVLEGGREFGTWGEIRLGVTRGRGNADILIGDPTLGNLDFDIGEATLRLAADEIDNVDFPRDGYSASLNYIKSLDSLGASDEYDQWSISGIYARTWGRNTGIFAFRGDVTPDNDAPVQGLTTLGGLFRLSGFSENELTGQHSAAIATAWYRSISDLALLPSYAGFSLEYGNTFQEKGDIKFSNGLLAGSVFIGVDSFIGPVYVAYGRAEGGNDSFYLFIGRLFDN